MSNPDSRLRCQKLDAGLNITGCTMLAPRMTLDQNCLEKIFGASSKNPIVASTFHSAVGMLPLVYTAQEVKPSPLGFDALYLC